MWVSYPIASRSPNLIVRLPSHNWPRFFYVPRASRFPSRPKQNNMSSPAGQKRSANHLTTSPVDAKKPKNGSITSFFGPPKAKTVGPKSTSSYSSSFNKQGWVESLTPEQRKLLQLEIDTLDESWLAQLKEELVTPEFLALKRFLLKEKQSGVKIFPPENEIYSWYSAGMVFSDSTNTLTLL